MDVKMIKSFCSLQLKENAHIYLRLLAPSFIVMGRNNKLTQQKLALNWSQLY